jgi:hypothetical protein
MPTMLMTVMVMGMVMGVVMGMDMVVVVVLAMRVFLMMLAAGLIAAGKNSVSFACARFLTEQQ